MAYKIFTINSYACILGLSLYVSLRILHEIPIHLHLPAPPYHEIFLFRTLSEDCSNLLHNMAPRLNRSKLLFISDMIKSQSLTHSQIAEVAECSKQTVKISAETCDCLETYMPH